MAQDSYHPSEEHRSAENSLRIENQALAKGFTLIPNTVLRARAISRDAKLLYGILLSYAWQKGSCWPGYDTLIADLQCGRPQLAKYIKELKAAGLIRVQRRGQGLTSIYTIADAPPETDDGQKFQNETSRSSESKRLAVSKRNGEEYEVEKDPGEEDPERSLLRRDHNLSNSKGRTRTKTAGRAVGSQPSAPPIQRAASAGLTRVGEVIQPAAAASSTVPRQLAATVSVEHPIPQRRAGELALPGRVRPSEKPEKGPRHRRVAQHTSPDENAQILAPTAPQTQRYPTGAVAEEDPEHLAALDYTIREVSTKLGDARHWRSNVTQARRIFEDSGLNANAWTGLVWSVYHRTAEQKGRLAKPAAWFFTALREEVEQRTASAHGTSLLASLTEHLAAQPRETAETRTAPPLAFPPLPRDTQAEPLWQAVLDELAQTVTRPIYETYLAGTRGTAVEAGQLVVSVPTDYSAEWLGRKLAPLIQQSLTRITGIAAGVILKAEAAGSSSARPLSATHPAPVEHSP